MGRDCDALPPMLRLRGLRSWGPFMGSESLTAQGDRVVNRPLFAVRVRLWRLRDAPHGDTLSRNTPESAFGSRHQRRHADGLRNMYAPYRVTDRRPDRQRLPAVLPILFDTSRKSTQSSPCSCSFTPCSIPGRQSAGSFRGPTTRIAAWGAPRGAVRTPAASRWR